MNVETIIVSKGYPVCRMSGFEFEILRPTGDSHCSNIVYHSISFGDKGFLSGDEWNILICLIFSLSCIEEGNGNPLQYSCLENPRDGGAWWAGIYGVA